MSDAALDLGSLPLLSSGPHGSGAVIEALGEGAGWGNAESVIASVASMLMDGDKARINRRGNREARVPLRIRGADLDVVSLGEAAVVVEVNRGRNVLRWKPPGIETVSVFDVVYSDLSFEYDDFEEARATRYFTLVLECLPFARREDPTVVVAEPILDDDTEPTWTTIDDCTSLDGWSGPHPLDGTLTVVGGSAIKVARTTNRGSVSDVFAYRRELSVETSAEDLIVVEAEADLWPANNLRIRYNDGDSAPQLVALEPVSASRAKYYFAAPGVTIDTIFINAGGVIVDHVAPGQVQYVLTIHDISKVDKFPFTGTSRQRSFVAEIGGTARTSADLVVETDGDALGSDVIVHTQPTGGIAPSMHQWLTSSGTATPDATCITGSYRSLASPSVYEIPAALLGGTYSIVAMLGLTSGSGDRTIGWSATTDAALATSATDESGSVTATLTTATRPVEIGVVTLPTAAVDRTSEASVVLTVTGNSSVLVDDVWLFKQSEDGTCETSRFSGINGATKVEVRSASLDNPRPSWVIGTAGTDADDVSAVDRIPSAGEHQFAPGLMEVFVVTPGATEQTVTVEAYERFLHNVTPRES